ncbi:MULTISPECIES: TetR/AcrR family transcriptional regulator [Actinoplanes]|uniref:TetR/AcrR family transcriptional regulator n=1 Tax=Actinoplanes TaxID=1865 RepID=UPI001FDFF137|nr:MULTISPECIES: TetR/AcrR family transcriptional regulator [Actinoplanes]GLY03173.1 putative TetR-family transcriptional regulator [Actinoplanes sp. NBRC 101535]
MRNIGYHHGNLRRAIIDAALQATAETGPTGWSLRELARRSGVSHVAPVHHFGDKTGVLTAVAAEGYELFADALAAAGDDFFEVGVAYVRFALSHRAHFQVMFRPDLYRRDDPDVVSAERRAAGILRAGSRTLSGDAGPDRALTLAAWSTVHGFASLWLNGSMAESADGDPEATIRAVLRAAFVRP